MTKERDDAHNDPLEDVNLEDVDLEEIDLDSLLEEVDEENAPRPASRPRPPGSPPSGSDLLDEIRRGRRSSDAGDEVDWADSDTGLLDSDTGLLDSDTGMLDSDTGMLDTDSGMLDTGSGLIDEDSDLRDTIRRDRESERASEAARPSGRANSSRREEAELSESDLDDLTALLGDGGESGDGDEDDATRILSGSSGDENDDITRLLSEDTEFEDSAGFEDSDDEDFDLLGEDDLLDESDLDEIEQIEPASASFSRSEIPDSLPADIEDSDTAELVSGAGDEELSGDLTDLLGADGGDELEEIGAAGSASGLEDDEVTDVLGDFELPEKDFELPREDAEREDAQAAALGSAVVGTAGAAEAKSSSKSDASSDDADEGSSKGKKKGKTEVVSKARGAKTAGSKSAGGKTKFAGSKSTGRKASGRTGAKAPKSKPKKELAVKAPRAPSGKVLDVVCSECYTTIALPMAYSKDQVGCPECFHVGKKPDENFLNKVALHKSGERSSAVVTLVVGLLMVLSLGALVYLRSPFGAAAFPEITGDDLSTWTLILLGSGGLLTIIFVVLLWRFENNRWEAYF